MRDLIALAILVGMPVAIWNRLIKINTEQKKIRKEMQEELRKMNHNMEKMLTSIDTLVNALYEAYGAVDEQDQ